MLPIDEENFKYTIAEKIKYFRKETQETVSEKAQISIDTMSSVERGKAVVSSYNLVKICNAIGVTPNDILEDFIENKSSLLDDKILKEFQELSDNEKHLKTTSYFKTWIIKILINECNNIYKSNNKQFWIFNKISNSKTNHISENIIQNIEDNFDFELLLKNINYDERIVIILYFNNRFSTTEIADILNISVNTVKSRLLRAKEKIKKDCKGGMKL